MFDNKEKKFNTLYLKNNTEKIIIFRKILEYIIYEFIVYLLLLLLLFQFNNAYVAIIKYKNFSKITYFFYLLLSIILLNKKINSIAYLNIFLYYTKCFLFIFSCIFISKYIDIELLIIFIAQIIISLNGFIIHFYLKRKNININEGLIIALIKNVLFMIIVYFIAYITLLDGIIILIIISIMNIFVFKNILYFICIPKKSEENNKEMESIYLENNKKYIITYEDNKFWISNILFFEIFNLNNYIKIILGDDEDDIFY